MLGVSDAGTLTELWDQTEPKAALPAPPEEFFAPRGPVPDKLKSKRAHQRHYLRRQAILTYELAKYAVYLQDCSRMGMGLISPVQLFPRQRVQLWTDGQRSYRLEVTRCRRRAANCYECGTVFVLR